MRIASRIQGANCTSHARYEVRSTARMRGASCEWQLAWEMQVRIAPRKSHLACEVRKCESHPAREVRSAKNSLHRTLKIMHANELHPTMDLLGKSKMRYGCCHKTWHLPSFTECVSHRIQALCSMLRPYSNILVTSEICFTETGPKHIA